ncbi:MAG: acyltransferase [Ardenticatenaceae bacterium]|nr:acyltransferase [Ardenticatenaceae bacterium]
MDKIQTEKPKAQRWQSYTLAQYVALRNGVPLGDGRSLRNMLQRSFGAASFAGFWRYWNPIWGYGLGRYVYVPLRRVLPPAVAFILTFAISGGLHDLATMAVRWSPAFLFTPWFVLLGIGAVLGRIVGMDLGKRPFWMRAAVNLTYLIVCLLPALALRKEIL